MTPLQKAGENIFENLNADLINYNDEYLYSAITGDAENYTINDIEEIFFDEYNELADQADETELQVICKDIAEHLNLNIKTIRAKFKAFHAELKKELVG